MNLRRGVLLSVCLVLLSGCTSLPAQQTQRDRPEAVQVDGPTCTVGGQPCSTGPFTEFAGTATIRMAVTNNAGAPIDVKVGKNGRQIMVSKCNDQLVKIGDFTVEKAGRSGASGGEKRITVKKGQRLVMQWTLNLVGKQRAISRLGNSCPMGFELTFTQREVKTAQQVQLKKNGNVPDVSAVDTRTNVKRPVRLNLEVPQSIVAADDRRLVTEAYFRNVGDGSIISVGGITSDTSTGGSSAFSGKKCNTGQEIRMFSEGPRDGESYRRSCSFDLPAKTALGASSVLEWIRFKGSYTYHMPLGTETIGLKPTAQEGGG